MNVFSGSFGGDRGMVGEGAMRARARPRHEIGHYVHDGSATPADVSGTMEIDGWYSGQGGFGVKPFSNN